MPKAQPGNRPNLKIIQAPEGSVRAPRAGRKPATDAQGPGSTQLMPSPMPSSGVG